MQVLHVCAPESKAALNGILRGDTTRLVIMGGKKRGSDDNYAEFAGWLATGQMIAIWPSNFDVLANLRKANAQMARVSIGLPVYEGENFVEHAIESVLAQTFQDWELIISDNASQDCTEEICRRYAETDSRIRYFREPENRGAAWNFNRVFHLAEGEYFRWLSHDDVLTPDVLTACVNHLDHHDDVLCSTTTKIIDSCGHQLLDDWPQSASGQTSGPARSRVADSDLGIQGLTQASEDKRIRLAADQAASLRFAGVLMHSLRCHEVYGLIRRDIMASTGLHRNYCGGEKVFLAELALLGTFAEVSGPAMLSRWHEAQCSSISSAAGQREHMDPSGGKWFALPHQYRATLGYLKLAFSRRLSLVERVRCLAVWGKFVFQYKKWANILANTVAGRENVTTAPRCFRRGPVIVPSQHADRVAKAVGSDASEAQIW